jgi:hypothetical protein
MRIAVWTLMFTLIFLAACGQTRIVEKPVPVEVITVERVPVPDDLLIEHMPSTIPEGLTYGEAIQLWMADRDTIAIHNGQIKAIKSLNDGH